MEVPAFEASSVEAFVGRVCAGMDLQLPHMEGRGTSAVSAPDNEAIDVLSEAHGKLYLLTVSPSMHSLGAEEERPIQELVNELNSPEGIMPIAFHVHLNWPELFGLVRRPWNFFDAVEQAVEYTSCRGGRTI